MFSKVIKDIKSGQNLELYFTIIISFSVFVVSVFNIIDQYIINSFILAVLSLMTLHFLQERWQRQELNKKISSIKLSSQTTWYELKGKMEEKLKTAKVVKFMAISPVRILREYNEMLQNILDKGGEIWFLVVDPKSQAMELIAKSRRENQIDGEIFIDEIFKYFSNFLKKGKLKVKLMNYIPSHILTIIDGQLIFATVYSFKRVDPQRPSEMLTAQDDRFLFFLREFDDLWNDSTNIDLLFKNL